MTAPRATILLVEDEPEIRRFVRACLAGEGFKVVESASARRARIDAGSYKPDLAIVDLGLPDADGIEVIRGIREWSAMPIIVLSARSHERAKIAALDAGADDYVTKPFAIGEFLARVRAGLRHAVRPPTGEPSLKLGEVTVDLESRRAQRAGSQARLTATEARLLAILAKRLGLVATHRELLVGVWGPTHATDTQYLRVYMKQLREKLEADPVRPRYLLTEPGIGYRLLADE